ncbi:mitochondrial ribosomal protein L54 [Ptiloglossa arizonensis]|uniref:mitochondrial ribosomal protein L54 n=1 Tax=Ptiloglossa arizonensis TaxID=3350558 RepID=UPI003FA1547B
MSFLSALRLFQFKECFIIPAQYAIQTKNYAVATGKKVIKKMKIEKVQLPVEKDVNKLLTYVCGSNIYQTGEDVKLKPDSEYPDWLWTLRLKPKDFSELDPNTKEYWKYVRKHGLLQNNRKMKHRRFK